MVMASKDLYKDVQQAMVEYREKMEREILARRQEEEKLKQSASETTGEIPTETGARESPIPPEERASSPAKGDETVEAPRPDDPSKRPKKRLRSEPSTHPRSKSTGSRYKVPAGRNIVVNLPVETSVSTHRKELVSAADQLNFKEDARELSKLNPPEFYEEAIAHCFKGIELMVGFQSHYTHQRERARKERTEKEKIKGEMETLQGTVTTLRAQLEEACKQVKTHEGQVNKLSLSMEAKETEISRLRKVEVELKTSEAALQAERKKVDTLETELAVKDVTSRIKSLEDVLNGVLTEENARKELDFLQGMLASSGSKATN